MTGRRQFLTWTAAAGFLAACGPGATGANGPKTSGAKALALHKDGLGILDTGTGTWLLPPGPAAAGPDLLRLAAVQENRLSVWSAGGIKVTGLEGSWTPRAVGPYAVALVEGPAGHGIYQPASRSVTRIQLAGQEKVFDLPGNFEPEAFSPDGTRLYLLDYIPPQKPEFYRVRMMDLVSGEVYPLATKDKGPIPPGAEETMRGQGRQAVFDRERGILFTLYLHQQGHQHTGELLGVRPGSPDVHAFIHALHLQEGWAVCIDLPAPFGQTPAEGHALALGSGQLYAVNATAGVVARINTESLNVLSTKEFTPLPGHASAAVNPAGGALYVAAGDKLTDTSTVLPLDVTLQGLAFAPDGLLWSGTDGSAVCLDWAAKKVVSKTSVPGLQAVHAIVGQ